MEAVGRVITPINKLFKTPTPPETPKPATADDPDTQRAITTSVASRRKARGYRSTILSQQLMAPDAAALRETIGS